MKKRILRQMVLLGITTFLLGMLCGRLIFAKDLEGGHFFDKRAAESLKKMLKATRAEGMEIVICSSYRTMEKQRTLYENKVQRLMQEEGLSNQEAYEKAKNTVAYPGTSEHQLGLAVDLVAVDYQLLDERQAETEEAKWLMEHCLWREMQ